MITAELVMPGPVSWLIQAFVVLLLAGLIAALWWPTGQQVRHATGEDVEEPTGPALQDRTVKGDVGYDATETEWRS